MYKNKKALYLLATLFLFRLGGYAQANTPELWYWQHGYLATDQAVQNSEALIDRAKAAGYTGVAFYDSSFSFMSDSFWPAQNVTRMQQVMAYATSKGLKVTAEVAPFGDSRDALQANPNWAEASRVVGSQFQVNSAGNQLNFINSFPGLNNPGFESGRNAWFNMGDAGTGVDYSVAHSGIASGVITNAPANARFTQQVTLKPWRQYHLRVYYKSQNFSGSPAIYMFDTTNFNIMRLNVAYFNASGTQGWTELDYTFNSQDSTQGSLYVGVWGGSRGSLWFDDIQLEETALIYVTRRSGTPLQMYDPNNPGTVYQEGRDYNYITDNQMTASRTPFTDTYHAPTAVTLPAGTRLRPGQIVAIDSYSAFPIPGSLDISLCLTEPAVLNWMNQNVQSIKSVLPSGAGLFMQYDEIRQMNSDAACRNKNMTPGQLLSASLGQSIQTLNSAIPNAPLYVWSDMFDPYHNATSNYYYVEGDLSGSWNGLPSNVTVMNWNLGNLKNSLTWFSGQNSSQPTPHQQIIAGYYDSGNGTQAAQQELAAANGINGIRGLMYTTWNDDYSQLENFAAAAQANWGAYLSSIGGAVTTAPVNSSVPPPASSTASLTTAPMQIIAKSSGKCVDVDGISKNQGALVHQWDCWAGPNQLWDFSANSDGTYQITSVNSGMALDVNGGFSATGDGAVVIQWPYWGAPNEKWQVQPTSDGYYQLVPQLSGKCLDVTGGPGATGNGVLLEQWACWGGDNQKFKIVPLQQ